MKKPATKKPATNKHLEPVSRCLLRVGAARESILAGLRAADDLSEDLRTIGKLAHETGDARLADDLYEWERERDARALRRALEILK